MSDRNAIVQSGDVLTPDAAAPTLGTPSAEHEPSRSPSRAFVAEWGQRLALLILTLGCALFFSVWGKTSHLFPTSANLQVLIASQAVVGIVAIAVLLPLVANNFDLSVGAVAGLGAVVLAKACGSHDALLLSIVLAVGTGLLVGLANGLLTTRLHIHAVVTTLGMSTVLAGLILQITHGETLVSGIPTGLTKFGNDTVLGIPLLGITLAAVALATWFVLDHTAFGRELYAFGSNANAAVLVGLRPGRIVVLTFLLSGVLAALGGVLYVAQAGSADPSVGPSFLLPAFAAAFLSAAAVKPGQFNVWGTLIAVYFLAVLNNGMNLAGAQPYVQNYVNGAALIAGVALAGFVHRRKALV